MKNFEIKLDDKMIILYKLMAFYKNKSKITENSDKLYNLTQEYLRVLNVNPKFLDKPAIIERVKTIIFSNLFLNKDTKLISNGISVEDKEKNSKKLFSVLKNGSIIFFSQSEKEKLTVCFDELDEQLTCRFLEYRNNDILKYEKRVLIDEYGFDKRYFEIQDDIYLEDVNESFRETFKNIITHVNGKEITAFADWGNHSITPLLDNKFLCDRKYKNK